METFGPWYLKGTSSVSSLEYTPSVASPPGTFSDKDIVYAYQFS